MANPGARSAIGSRRKCRMGNIKDERRKHIGTTNMRIELGEG